jgi:Tfp pilus assembly protein PilF
MKISSKKIAVAMLGMAFMGTAVHAQSLDDAKKAINAEQYQKAKSMLKNLTGTQSSKDENFFYLGWVYILQDYPDSAKATFEKGIAINNKSALNYVGLGAVAHVDKDNATATTNFNQAVALSKKDTRTYTYIAKAYLLDPANADAAITVAQQGKAISDKDPELDIALADAYRFELKSTDAYNSYEDALTINPNSPVAIVALGVLWKFSNNFDGAEGQFQAALKIDPNFGPAYREWAETDARWAKTDPTVAVAKLKEAADNYKKYLSLTDVSVESQMRYADFLISSGDYQTLQQVATDLSKSANTNLRIYRYLGYAGYENKDYAAGLTALNTWMTKADPKRIIPRDYLYLGRLQVASGQDSVGIITLQKAYDLDTTQVEVLGEIAKSLYKSKKYLAAGNQYTIYLSKSKQGTLTDYFSQGRSYYFAYEFPPQGVKPDTSLLTKADSAFTKVQQKATSPVAVAALYLAFTNDLKEPDRTNIKGLAKPFYEQYIALTLAKPTIAPGDKKFLAQAYDYLGRYYEFVTKDMAQATDDYTKAAADDPTDAEATAFLAKHK